MSRSFLWIPAAILGCLFLLLAFTDKSGEVQFFVPKGWPKPNHNFSKKPVTEAGFILGNRLFYDPILSKDSTISCSSCHLSFTAFTHADHKVSHGIYGRQGIRNSSTLINLAWSKHFMWDGAIQSLEQQAVLPISHFSEMDNSMEEVVRRLSNNTKYRSYFYKTFADSTVTEERVLNALWQFTVMLVSYNAKYDSIMRHEPNVSFSPNEAIGYQIFKKNCASCHTEPLFTNNSFKNNGLPLDSILMDPGRMAVTGKQSDYLAFKVPTLRNIAFSNPYFHDGRFNKLSEAIDHYTNGIVQSPTLAKELRRKITLSRQEKKDLIAFLKTLTDKPFLYNIAFRYDYPF